MTSPWVAGLLKGAGQGAAIAGEKALNEHYEHIRMNKRQQFNMDELEKRQQYDMEKLDKRIEADNAQSLASHERAVDLEGVRHQNNLVTAAKSDELARSRLQEQREWELNNMDKRSDLWLDDNGNLSDTGSGAPSFQRGSDGTLYDMRRSSSGKQAALDQKNHFAYLKRKHELENMLTEGTIETAKFEDLLAQARIDYGVEIASTPGSNLAPTPEDMLKAFMSKNNVSQEEAFSVLAEKYPAMFSAKPLTDKKAGLLNPDSIEARRIKAEEIRRRKEEENRAAILKDQQEHRNKVRYQDDSANQLSLIQQYRMRNQENNQ